MRSRLRWTVQGVLIISAALCSYGVIKYIVLGAKPAYLDNIHAIGINANHLQEAVASYSKQHRGQYPTSIEDLVGCLPHEKERQNPLSHSPIGSL